ncbi:MAG: ATP-binding protein [Brevinematales bacterium]|nr:ATP-binding protein [Brevinematales bacterium]
MKRIPLSPQSQFYAEPQDSFPLLTKNTHFPTDDETNFNEELRKIQEILFSLEEEEENDDFFNSDPTSNSPSHRKTNKKHKQLKKKKNWKELVENIRKKYIKKTNEGEVLFDPPSPRKPNPSADEEIILESFPRLLQKFKKNIAAEKKLQKWGIKRPHTHTDPNITRVILLLYGPSGTGKSLTVELLAQKNNADILEINANHIFHRYMGESPKNAENIFNYYQELFELYHAHNRKIFLVVNEADQIFSTRRALMASVDQELNSCQNIFLTKLEHFKGYFIATTNLPENFDKAFWRRFTLKWEIPFPDETTRKKLWDYYLPKPPYRKKEINEDFLEKLAKYPLSGGQIVNIVIQAAYDAVYEDRHISQKDLTTYIEAELGVVENKYTRIGF